jgi:hypothetical protein
MAFEVKRCYYLLPCTDPEMVANTRCDGFIATVYYRDNTFYVDGSPEDITLDGLEDLKELRDKEFAVFDDNDWRSIERRFDDAVEGGSVDFPCSPSKPMTAKSYCLPDAQIVVTIWTYTE